MTNLALPDCHLGQELPFWAVGSWAFSLGCTQKVEKMDRNNYKLTKYFEFQKQVLDFCLSQSCRLDLKNLHCGRGLDLDLNSMAFSSSVVM